MIKIGVLSDTHRKIARAKKAIDLLVSKGAEYFIHAGDIVETEVLDYLEETDLPYVCVYGNNDAHLMTLWEKYPLFSEPYMFRIENVRFKLMHLPLYLTPDSDVVIYGHTHVKEVTYTGDTLYLNPGEVCARNKPLSECMMLKISDKKFKVHYYSRKIGQENWEKQKQVYKR